MVWKILWDSPFKFTPMSTFPICETSRVRVCLRCNNSKKWNRRLLPWIRKRTESLHMAKKKKKSFLSNHKTTFRDLRSRKESCDWTGTLIIRCTIRAHATGFVIQSCRNTMISLNGFRKFNRNQLCQEQTEGWTWLLVPDLFLCFFSLIGKKKRLSNLSLFSNSCSSNTSEQSSGNRFVVQIPRVYFG